MVGPSGSGKSTLGLALAGLIPGEIPGSVQGELSVAGLDPRTSERGRLAATVGIVFQDPGSQSVLERVEDDVAFGLENRGWSLEAMRERVPEAIAEAGLLGLERRRSNRLSGGQQQRLALAGVMAPRPAVLVLDEPTANLDPASATAFFDRLSRLSASRATTIVLVEHRVDAAWPLADLVLALGPDGAPIDVGAPAEVLRRSAQRMADAGIWLPGPVAAAEHRRPAAVSTVGSPVVETNRLGYAYEAGAPVLRDIDLAFRAGERVALVGPNGSGKSTLGRLLVGLLRATEGAVRLGGSDPARLAPADLARRAGYVFQDPEAGFLTDTVADEVMLGLTDPERAAAATLADRLRLPLDRFGARSPYRLSGGEARRLSLACTLVRRPGVLVLDEPTFGQDRLGYDGLLEILHERIDDGACLVIATHDERLVAEVASRVVTLDGGRVVADGCPGGSAMISARDLAPAQLDSPLGRTSPVLKLAIAIGWFVGLATTIDAWPPLVIAGVAVGSALAFGRVPPSDLARAVAPVWLAALGLAFFNTVFAAANGDPTVATIAQVGPFRITEPALAAGIGPRTAADRDRRRGCRLRADHRLDPPRGLACPAGPPLGAVRVWGPGRLPGAAALRRGPHDASPGASDPRASGRLASPAAGRPPRPRHPSR